MTSFVWLCASMMAVSIGLVGTGWPFRLQHLWLIVLLRLASITLLISGMVSATTVLMESHDDAVRAAALKECK